MKKLLAIVLVASFAFVGAINASAVTIEELQAQIATLLQQIAALQGTSTPAATTTCFSTDLSQGMTSNDVKLLQEKLGVINTGYFGPLTLAAVKTFQGSNSIPTTGYVGPMTRAALNTKYCTTTPVTTSPTTVTTTPAVDATEGTLSATTSPSYIETKLKKGDSQKSILAAKLEAKNSDINVQRVDVNIAAASIQPWKTYSSFELYVNGSLIKGIPALKENFLENTFGANYTLRFDNISFTVPKAGSVDVVVKASIPNNPENTTTGTFTFQVNAFRGRDGKNLDQYAGSAIITGTASQKLDAASTGTLTFSLSSSSPKAGFVIGNKTNTTSDKEIAKFDVKAENRDVTIKTFKTTITDHATAANQLISAVKLYDGSTLLASAAYAAEVDGAGTSGDLNGDGDDNAGDLVATFSNLAVLIAKDTTKTLTIKVDLKPIDGTTITEGLTATAGIDTNATNFTAVDSNDDMLAQAQLNSNTNSVITGKLMTAYTKAPLLTFVSANITKTVQAGQADQADATIVFDITAQGGDIYFKSATGALGTVVVDDGMTTHNNFDAANGGDLGVGTYTFTSTAEVYDANTFLVRSGQTARITVSGHVTNVGATGYTNMALDQLIWGTDTTPTEYTIKGITATVNYDLTQFKTNDVSLTRV